MKAGLMFGISMLSLRDKETAMKIRYAIEKEIEVPDNHSDTMIDDILKESVELRKASVGFGKMKMRQLSYLNFFRGINEGLDCGEYRW